MTALDREKAEVGLFEMLTSRFKEFKESKSGSKSNLINPKRLKDLENADKKGTDFEFDPDIFENEIESTKLLNNPIESEEVSRKYHYGKKFDRTYMQAFTSGRSSITKVRNNYLIGHHTAADLSVLKDFNDFKEEIDIVNNSIVTLKKPILIDGVNVIIRDTKLLAPGGSKSLGQLGALYNQPKLNIGK